MRGRIRDDGPGPDWDDGEVSLDRRYGGTSQNVAKVGLSIRSLTTDRFPFIVPQRLVCPDIFS